MHVQQLFGKPVKPVECSEPVYELVTLLCDAEL